jgi:hypothetical protein
MSCGLVAAAQDRRGGRFKLSVCAKVLFIWKVLPLFPFGKDTKVVHIGAVSLLLWTGIESTFYFFARIVRRTSGHVELAAGNFNLSMRLYGPQMPVLNGSCRLPAVAALQLKTAFTTIRTCRSESGMSAVRL